jgi:L-iditol 2-dehydrogenase|uniref:zinc-dependent alcohol dehydrogenase n=1 Tax=Candidatus Planktophila sp. TaxID=2175601 RepID=UPI0040490695
MTVIAGGTIPTLTKLREISITHADIPVAQSGEELVKIRTAGVCGTDLHLYEADWGYMPVVLGHDAVGEIVSTGQRVAIDPSISCRNCKLCLAGRSTACAEYRFLGMTAPGAFASYLTLPKENLHVLPESVSDEAGTVLEPITVGLHTIERLLKVVSNAAPLIVVGGGPIGIVAAKLLQLNGFDVQLVEPLSTRRDKAIAWGIAAVDPSDLKQYAINGERAVAIETSSSKSGAQLAMDWVGTGGVIVAVGAADLPLTYVQAVLSDQTLIGIHGGARRHEKAIELVASGAIPVGELISHQDSIANLEAVINATNANPLGVYRTVLRH